MKQHQGFVIARNKSADVFFTSGSSYDYPKWISITEATVYPTAELAQLAATKLWKYGNYSASVRSLAEAMPFQPPKTIEPEPIDPSKTPSDFDSQQEIGSDEQIEDPESEMKAGQGDDFDPDEVNLDDEDIETIDDDEFVDDEDDAEFDDDELGEEEPDFENELEPSDDEFENAPEENEISFETPIEQNMRRGKSSKYPQGQGPIMGESGIPTDVTTIKYKQQVNEPADVNFSDEIGALHNPHKTPADIIQSLKNDIAEFENVYEYNNGKDDSQASMALTISSAMKDLLTDLEQGTIEGLTQAQIRLSSYMGPILTNIPTDVKDYLYKRGRQPIKLKNIFYDKWNTKG